MKRKLKIQNLLQLQAHIPEEEWLIIDVLRQICYCEIIRSGNCVGCHLLTDSTEFMLSRLVVFKLRL